MSKYLCADCVLREQCDSEWTMRCASYVPKEYEQTNKEWLQTATTEQLAGFIADICYELQDEIWSNCEDTSWDYHQTDKNYWVEWLKKPHTD